MEGSNTVERARTTALEESFVIQKKKYGADDAGVSIFGYNYTYRRNK